MKNRLNARLYTFPDGSHRKVNESNMAFSKSESPAEQASDSRPRAGEKEDFEKARAAGLFFSCFSCSVAFRQSPRTPGAPYPHRHAQLPRCVLPANLPERHKNGLLIGSYRDNRISLPHGRHNICHPAHDAHFYLILQAKIIQAGLAKDEVYSGGFECMQFRQHRRSFAGQADALCVKAERPR